jgi:hypothetical protein
MAEQDNGSTSGAELRARLRQMVEMLNPDPEMSKPSI